MVDRLIIINTSNQSLKLYGNEIKIGNELSFRFSRKKAFEYFNCNGGASAIVVNEDGNTDNFRIEGGGQAHLFFTDGTQ